MSLHLEGSHDIPTKRVSAGKPWTQKFSLGKVSRRVPQYLQGLSILPKTNMSPESRASEKEISSSKGAILASGRVGG